MVRTFTTQRNRRRIDKDVTPARRRIASRTIRLIRTARAPGDETVSSGTCVTLGADQKHGHRRGTQRGVVAPPGEYRVRLIAGNDTLTQPLSVVGDPRLKISDADYQAQFTMGSRVVERISEIAETVTRIEDVQRQVDERVRQTSSQPFAARVKEITNGALCEAVYDGVGKATFPASLDCLKPFGTFASFGSASSRERKAISRLKRTWMRNPASSTIIGRTSKCCR